jgi:hypothetical protein
VLTNAHAAKEMATSVTDAAKHAMAPEPLKPGDKVFLVPMAGDGADPLMSPSPMTPVVISKKKRKAPAKPAPAKIIAPKKAVAKKATKKSSKKAPKKDAKKTVKKSGKKTKSSAGRKSKKKKAKR